MKAIKEVKRFFLTSVVFLSVMSLSILFMPMAVNSMNNIWVVLVGLTFYIGAIGGYVLIVIAGVLIKKHLSILKEKRKTNKDKLGLVSFFSNLPALIFDILMLISIIAFCVVCLLDYIDIHIPFIVLSIMVLSINMHCLFNGRIYKFIKIRGTRESKSDE